MPTNHDIFSTPWAAEIPGLKALGFFRHHCHCDRAMTFCLGVHEIACKKYHATPLRLGNEEARCKACNEALTERKKRLQAIADVAIKIDVLRGEEEEMGEFGSFGTPRKGSGGGNSKTNSRRHSFIGSPPELSRKENKEQKKREKAMRGVEAVQPSAYLEKVEIVLPVLAGPESLQQLDANMRYRDKSSGVFREEATIAELIREPVMPSFEEQAQAVAKQLVEDRRGDTSEVFGLIRSLPKMIEDVLVTDYNEDVNTRKRRISYARWVYKLC